MNLLKRLFHRESAADEMPAVIVVSGLPRSGTSMTMRMLEAAGLDILTDQIRTPNIDNPRGYYEFERVKKLPDGDVAWVRNAQGKVVKVIAALLKYLPPAYTYKVLFMRRHMDEILASQRQMLVRRGEDPEKVNDAEMARLFEKHVTEVHAWMDAQPHLSYIDVDYNTLLVDPRPQLAQVVAFLGCDLDIDRMAGVVDPALYRQRGS